MTEGEPVVTALSLKILYTLHGVDSQKFVVKPPKAVKVRVYRELGLGTVDSKLCIESIRAVSPELASICKTHLDEYALYSADYAEEGCPLQSHGKLSQATMVDATGKLCSSKLIKEQLELLFHLLPVRKPDEMISEYNHIQRIKAETIASDQLLFSDNSTSQTPQFPFPPPPSFMRPGLLQNMPAMPMQVQIPPTLNGDFGKSSLRSDPALPSSPPIKGKLSKSALLDGTSGSVAPARGIPSSEQYSGSTAGSSNAKRNHADYSSIAFKRRKALSPKTEGDSQCSNCGVEAASTWRRIESSDGKKDLLCNACGLYFKSKHVMRPSSLWDKMRNRGDTESNTTAQASLVAPRGQSTLSSQQAVEPSQSRLQQQSGIKSTQNTLQPSFQATEMRQSYPSHPLKSVSQNTLRPNGENSNNAPQNPSAKQLSEAEIKLENAGDPYLFWSQGHGPLPQSDALDISDRLIDSPNSASKSQYDVTNSSFSDHTLTKDDRTTTSLLNADLISNTIVEDFHRQNYDELSAPRTPGRKITLEAQELDSIQKLFDVNTPDQRNCLMLPGSGSASKWLRRVMNPASFEEFLRSPTPRKIKSNDLSILTSSPPTSSNLFSDMPDWPVYATGSPRSNIKLFDQNIGEN